MSAVISGRATYFDGERAAAREVDVDLRAEGVALTFEDRSTAFWSREEILTTPLGPGSANGLVLAYEGPDPRGASIVLEEVRLVRGWQSLSKRTGRERPIFDPGDVRRTLQMLALIAVLALLIARGLPILGRACLPLIPLDLDRAIGKFAVQDMRKPGKFEFETLRVGALEQLLARLTRQLEHPRGFTYRLTFLTDKQLVNAFATPGGEVVVTQGIVSLAPSAEALSGVLAHEIQHVEHRHGTTAMLQTLGLALFLHALGLGDLNLVHELARTSYGRELERQADLEGVELLLRARIDPHPLLDLFEQMEKSHGKSESPAWLRDHPTMVSRVSAIRRKIGDRPETFEPLDLGMPWSEIQNRPVPGQS